MASGKVSIRFATKTNSVFNFQVNLVIFADVRMCLMCRCVSRYYAVLLFNLHYPVSHLQQLENELIFKFIDDRLLN